MAFVTDTETLHSLDSLMPFQPTLSVCNFQPIKPLQSQTLSLKGNRK